MVIIIIFVTVSEEKKLLPRYYYHQYMLNSWLRPGLIKIPNFQEWVLKVSPIIVGGALDEKQREVLFRDSLSEIVMDFHVPSKGKPNTYTMHFPYHWCYAKDVLIGKNTTKYITPTERRKSLKMAVMQYDTLIPEENQNDTV